MKEEHLYLKVAESLKRQIKEGLLKPGDRLSSLRAMSREKKVSINTVLQAYLELEKLGLILSKPQSGFYVNYKFRSHLALPSLSNPTLEINNNTVEHIFSTVFGNNGKIQTVLSSGQIAPDLLPVSKLTRELIRATKSLPYAGLPYDRTDNKKLKRQIALRSQIWGGNFKSDDIILTSGCMHAMTLCMQALLKKGDTIGVESPIHFGIINLIRKLGFDMIELPTDPSTGLDLDVLKKTVHTKKIQMLILMGNFSSPFGTCMPVERKKELVKIMEHYDVPVIENDIYGDIYFNNPMPAFCKAFDKSGIILWCGSASKTLAGGYKTGWLEAGKFKDRILKSEPHLPTSNNPLAQEAIGSFFENKGFDHFQKKLNQVLSQNLYLFHKAIINYFPDNIKVTQPQGGIQLWLEFSDSIHCLDFYNKALSKRIGIRPGRIYTNQDQFNNAITLSYGIVWSEAIEKSLKTLGELCKKWS